MIWFFRAFTFWEEELSPCIFELYMFTHVPCDMEILLFSYMFLVLQDSFLNFD